MAKDTEVIAAYIKLRNQKAEIVARQKEELKPIAEKMDLIEAYMLAKLDRDGSDSTKTKEGTAFITTQTQVRMEDRGAFLEYAQEHDLLHMLTNSLAKDSVLSFVESNGTPPPGVSITRIRVCQFRSPTK